jgi:HPt (histidine-containing phosphotransfer) domain-containing protein
MKPVLDRTKLQGLKAVLGEEKCDAALKRFQDELGTCLSAIEAGTPESAESAHRLAGVAGLLGFDDLEDHSRRFLAAVHQERGDIASSTDALVEAAHRAEAELAQRAVSNRGPVS